MEHTTHCGLQQAEAARGPRTDESAREAGRVMFTSHQNITPFRLFITKGKAERRGVFRPEGLFASFRGASTEVV